MLGFKKSQILIELLVINSSLGFINEIYAYIANNKICCKAQRKGNPMIKPVKDIGQNAVNGCTQHHSQNLFSPKRICLVEVPEKINLRISDEVAGKDHLRHMKNAGIIDLDAYSVHAIEKQNGEKIKARLKFNSDFLGEILFPKCSFIFILVSHDHHLPLFLSFSGSEYSSELRSIGSGNQNVLPGFHSGIYSVGGKAL